MYRPFFDTEILQRITKRKELMPLSLNSISIYYYLTEKNWQKRCSVCFSKLLLLLAHLYNNLFSLRFMKQKVFLLLLLLCANIWQILINQFMVVVVVVVVGGESAKVCLGSKRGMTKKIENYTSLNLSHRELGDILQIQLSWSSVVAPRRVGW